MSRTIKQALNNESTKKADIAKAIIRRYIGNGIWLMKGLGCNNFFRASAGQGSISYPPGMSVNIAQIQGSFQRAIVSLPPPGRRGASAFPVATLGGGTLDALAVLRAAPLDLSRGTSGNVVTLTGSGFSETPVDLVRAVIFSTELQEDIEDPNVTVTSVTWISNEELEITVDVNILKPLSERISYEVSRA